MEKNIDSARARKKQSRQQNKNARKSRDINPEVGTFEAKDVHYISYINIDIDASNSRQTSNSRWRGFKQDVSNSKETICCGNETYVFEDDFTHTNVLKLLN